MTKPREYVIGVCKTCGRQAKWPFCEHVPTGYVPWDSPPWCEPIRVREVGRSTSRRAKAAPGPFPARSDPGP